MCIAYYVVTVKECKMSWKGGVTNIALCIGKKNYVARHEHWTDEQNQKIHESSKRVNFSIKFVLKRRISPTWKCFRNEEILFLAKLIVFWNLKNMCIYFGRATLFFMSTSDHPCHSMLLSERISTVIWLEPGPFLCFFVMSMLLLLHHPLLYLVFKRRVTNQHLILIVSGLHAWN